MIRTPLVCLALFTMPFAALAADDPKQKEDLTAVIHLNGQPCVGGVVNYTVQGESDFMATCKDGNRYRVWAKDGRVVVEKR